jgi:hypothetical protein
MTTYLRSESDSESRVPARFVSAKTRGSIALHTAALHDFAIVATLDPDIIAILPADPVQVVVDGCAVTHTPDVMVQRSTGLAVIDIRPRAVARKPLHRAVGAALAQQNFRYEVRDTAAALGLISRSRLVWSCRDYEVRAGDQFAVLCHLADAAGTAPLCEVEKVVRHAGDRRAAVFGMCCHGVLEIDLQLGLCDESPVRRRRWP